MKSVHSQSVTMSTEVEVDVTVEVQVILPVYSSAADICLLLEDLQKHTPSGPKARVHVTLAPLLCTDEDRMACTVQDIAKDGGGGESPPLPAGAEYATSTRYTVVHDKQHVQALLLQHEITEIPCAIVTSSTSTSTSRAHGRGHGQEEVIPLRLRLDLPSSALRGEGRGGDNAQQPPQPPPAFIAALEQYDLFNFSAACELFSKVILDNSSSSSSSSSESSESSASTDQALFNMAGLMHMLGYPTLAVHYVGKNTEMRCGLCVCAAWAWGRGECDAGMGYIANPPPHTHTHTHTHTYTPAAATRARGHDRPHSSLEHHPSRSSRRA